MLGARGSIKVFEALKTHQSQSVEVLILQFNDIIREEAERYGVLVMDFLQHPIIQDPRLFSRDRLHASELGHERLAAALASRSNRCRSLALSNRCSGRSLSATRRPRESCSAS